PHAAGVQVAVVGLVQQVGFDQPLEVGALFAFCDGGLAERVQKVVQSIHQLGSPWSRQRKAGHRAGIVGLCHVAQRERANTRKLMSEECTKPNLWSSAMA